MRWRHKKRGTFYQELCRAELQAGRPLTEGDRLVVYVDDDGKTWCRPEGEFEDGRFEPAPRRDLTPEDIVALVNDG